jgi:putative tricarboxylic transport membrane protein
MRLTKDLLSGVMFLVFGAGAAVIAHGYDFGTPVRMGSGFFPVVIGVIIAILGLVLIVRSLIKPSSDEPVAMFHFRPLVFISAAIVIFGVLIEDAGLLAALAALIVVARFAGREGTPLELAVMVVVLVAVAVGIFVYGLNIRLKLGP